MPKIKPHRKDRRTFNKKILFASLTFALILFASLIGTNFINNPQKAGAAIILRSGSQNNSGDSVTSLSLNTTNLTGAKVGDIILVTLAVGGGTGVTVTAPTNNGTWTRVASADCTNGTNVKVINYWKEYNSSDPTSYTWSWGATNRRAVIGMVAYGGVNRTTPIDITGTCQSGSGTSLAFTGVTTTVGDTVLLGGIGQHNTIVNGQTTNPPASMTPIAGTLTTTNCTILCTDNNVSNRLADEARPTAGATGTRTFSSSSTASWAGHLFALRPATNPTLTQSAYRWLTDNDAANPTAAMAATNTAIANVKPTDTVRLRMLLDVTTAELQIDLVQFKLQYAQKGTGTCAAPQFSYGDVSTNSGAIQFKNITPADGTNIATTAVDPSHSGHTNVPQTFEEANNFVTRQITPSGQDAMWDFALTNNSAPNNTTYCFKIVNAADGSSINGGYTVYPELTTINITYNQAAYRWFNNADSATPGTALGAAQDTAITQVNTTGASSEGQIRLRMLLDNGGTDPIPVAYDNLKLQFAVRGSDNSCDTSFANETYGDVATGSGAIRYRNNATPADNATAVTATGDPIYLGHTVNLQYYKEANNFTTRVSQPGGQAGLWDFSLETSSAPFGTVYCFRAVKSDGSVLNTYTQVPQLTITNPTFEQAAYRWYDNNNGTTPGSARAANNTVTTAVAQSAQIRLRVLIHVGSDPIYNSTETFKLQFAPKTGASCGDDESFGDVATGSGTVRYLNNATPADAEATTTTANDPSHSGHSIRAQTYEETNNFTSNTNTAAGEDALWDFSLQTVSAPLRTTYCFKIVRSSGSDISTYTLYPELRTVDPKYEQSAYRWLANPASPTDTTPGSALAANNTVVTDISQNTVVRLRMLTHVSNDASGVGLENFKLQFAPRSGTCDTAFVGESGNFTDLTSGSGTFRYYDNTGVADAAAISATANDPSHGADTIVAQTYRESNPFATVTNTPAGQDAMWDFVIVNNSAAQNTAWCFRLIKTDGTTDFTSSGGSYTQVAELSTAIAAMNQSAYRWFTNVDTANYLSVGTNPTSGDDRVNATALDTTNGFIYMVGYEGATADKRWRIEKRSTSDGALVSGFGGTGCTTNTAGALCSDPTTGDDQAMGIAIDVSAGYMYVAGYDAGVSPATTAEWRVEKRNLSDGSLVSGTTSGGFANGVLVEDVYANADQINTIAIDAAGGYMYLGGFAGVGAGNQEIRIEKRQLSNGTLVTAFDTDGIIIEDLATNKNDAIISIVVDVSNGVIYAGGFDGSPPSANGTGWRVEKRNATTGAIVDGFGNHDSTKCDAASGGTTGVYCVDVNTGNNDDRVTALALDSTYLFVTGNDTTGAGQWRVDRITLSSNTITAPLFAVEDVTAGDDTIKALFSDGTNIYLAGYDNGVSPATTREWRYEKRTVAGALVTAFDSDGILVNDVTSGGSDQINAITIDISGGYIYAGGFDSGGSNQWRLEKRKTSDGTRGWEPTPLVAQDTKASVSSGIKFRLRMTIHISGENMPVNGETLKLQYAPKTGTCDTGFVGEEGNFQDVGSTGDISYADNSTAADEAATLALSSDPSHTGHTNVIQTYQEANPFTFNNAVTAGQEGLWDFALIDNTAFGNYCFRAVNNVGGSAIAATVVPEIVFCDRPKTENLLRGGNFFCDDTEKKFYWN